MKEYNNQGKYPNLLKASDVENVKAIVEANQVYLLMVGPIKDPQEEILVHLLRKDLMALIYMDSGLSHHLELERIDFGMDIS